MDSLFSILTCNTSPLCSLASGSVASYFSEEKKKKMKLGSRGGGVGRLTDFKESVHVIVEASRRS